MKNWKLFVWAVKRMKIDHDRNKMTHCFRNSVLMRVMNISGITPEDVQGRIDIMNLKYQP